MIYLQIYATQRHIVNLPLRVHVLHYTITHHVRKVYLSRITRTLVKCT